MLLLFVSQVMSVYRYLCDCTPLPKVVVDFYTWLWVTMDGESHPNRFVAIHSFGQHMICFWAIALPLLILDVYRKPSWLYKYKIQKATHQTETLWHCAKTILINEFFVLLPISAFGLYPLFVWRGCELSPKLMPSGFEIFVDLIVCVLVEEVLFYYSHRLLHSRWFYGPIHKQHHQFKSPVGMAAIYAHPIEFIFSNIVPLVVGSLVAKAHLFSMWVWFLVAIWSTIQHHCGYAFPWLLGTFAPNDHDYHHEKYEVHYGLLGWLDALHGTGTHAFNKRRAEEAAKKGKAKISPESAANNKMEKDD